MSRKVDRAIHGPSWAEVIIGAVLSLALGVALGAVLLIIKPVVTVKEPPKEPIPGTVYFIEGARTGTQSSQAMAKRKAFVEGRSVKVNEDEINSLAWAAATPATKPAAKAGEKAPESAGEFLAPGTPNVRIRNGTMQIAVPVALNVAGFSDQIMVQARGGFAKDGSVFVFEPDEVYLGSCPVQRLPFIAGFIRQKALSARAVPADIASAWNKLANVSVEGNSLDLTTAE